MWFIISLYTSCKDRCVKKTLLIKWFETSWIANCTDCVEKCRVAESVHACFQTLIYDIVTTKPGVGLLNVGCLLSIYMTYPIQYRFSQQLTNRSVTLCKRVQISGFPRAPFVPAHRIECAVKVV